ncbi:hypothetical protein P3S68_032148 [Capsicum galapagoense]
MESLEILHLEKCTHLKRFPKICGDMRRLSMLDVGSPWIRNLSPALSGLSYLKLKGCEVLESIPEAFRNLERLHISGLVELPVSLGIQKNLAVLCIAECENLRKLPNSIQMESLKELEISNCPKLDTFPEINRDVHCLKSFTLESTGIRELPSSIGNLRGLEFLSLKGCEDLVYLPNSLRNLTNLQRLILRGCKKFPENINDMQQLETLEARETAIPQPAPPPSIAKLGKLKELMLSHEQFQHSSSFVLHQVSSDLCNLNILGGLPEDLGSLQSLVRLDVSGSYISCLPKSIHKLSRLNHLNVQFCQNLNELPRELPSNLTELFADYHLALKSIDDLLNKCLKPRML